MKLLFTSSDSLVSHLIRRITWHDFSHVAIQIDETVWECNHRDGCIRIPLDQWMQEHAAQTVTSIDIWLDDVTEVAHRLNSRVGEGYNWTNLLLFPFNIDSDQQHKLICSQYIAWAINYKGKFFNHHKYHRLAPRHLFISAYSHSKART